MSEQQLIQVKAAPTFQRNLHQLAKKYRNIRRDIQPIIEQLEGGELPGDPISGIVPQFLYPIKKPVIFAKIRDVKRKYW